jgi:hypothetical protein
MSVSEDDGSTWTPLEPIGDFGGIVRRTRTASLKSEHFSCEEHQ